MSERHRNGGVRPGRGHRVVGAAASVGAFLAFGMTPVVVTPAQADFDLWDPLS